MDNFLHMTLLYDFYSELLTKKQQEFFTFYYFDNLSLKEIGEKYEITPQGVGDLLKRTEKILTSYEDKLKLLAGHVAKEKKTRDIAQKINKTNGMTDIDKNKLIAMISDL